MVNLSQMDELIDMLYEAGIEVKVRPLLGGLQVIYRDVNGDYVCDVVCHDGSYGREQGLLEIMGLLTEEEARYDDVAGWLTADDVFDRIHRHWSMEHL